MQKATGFQSGSKETNTAVQLAFSFIAWNHSPKDEATHVSSMPAFSSACLGTTSETHSHLCSCGDCKSGLLMAAVINIAVSDSLAISNPILTICVLIAAR